MGKPETEAESKYRDKMESCPQKYTPAQRLATEIWISDEMDANKWTPH